MDREIVLRMVRSWLGVAVRAIIVSGGAWLKASGKLPGALDDSVIAEWTDKAPQLAGDLMLLAGIGWSAIQKWVSHRHLQAQKDAPAGVPTAEAIKLSART